ncbi:MAG: ABC transporter permease subunit [Candidatus Eisenbacteria bacterium]|uniref:ABC transporter permease subunit n=1 Tax=Eiseniibacteriota bacterium TaxID=2212470 RepID=A0A538T5X3_UNCEI|nr:MAG: ABC transporter permease subunit [Candidatus Eisenbacteria bacterium]
MRAHPVHAAALGLLLLTAPATAGVTVGSKAFPESWILGEALAEETRALGVADVEHRSNLGGTEIVYQALRSGSVDVYPEYTGTLLEVILHAPRPVALPAMRAAMAKEGLGVSEPIGFNDSYALAVTRAVRERYALRTISDLARHPELKLGLTHEFMGRPDGYAGLAAHYGLRMKHVVGIQHELAYTALASGRIDVTDIYTTDAQIERLGLHVLEDDRGFFPRYDAVWLYRLDLAAREPRALEAILALTGKIDEARMIRANARVVLGGQTFRQSADSLLAEALGRAPARKPAEADVAGSILRNTGQHLKLVALSLLVAVLIGVPLGVIATRSPLIGSTILSLTGLLQTIPSLALLALLIPLFGIGVAPALIALFLYSLLPIVRNTYVGLTTIPVPLAEAAAAIGLSPRAQLFRVRLPMASPAIMAGIKTSAVINVGTATLAALIGAGGLGEPILSGIQLRQNSLILQGAIPAAVLALLVQRAFDLIDLVAVPRGLRLPPIKG